MKYVIIVNPNANQVRRDPKVLQTILRRFRNRARIVHSSTIALMHDELLEIGRQTDFSKVVLCIVGGDGTFKQLLDWVITLPEEKRPILMPAGGGQFNFMTKHVGFKNGDPVRNLSRLFAQSDQFVVRDWQPVMVHDSLTDTRRHGAVIANGVVSDSIEWYEQNGKGDMIGVARLITAICSDYFRSAMSGARGRVNHTNGKLSVDHLSVTPNNAASLVVGAVNNFLPKCHPFRNEIEPDRCGVIAYWGGLAALALSIPPLWIGSQSPLTDLNTCNTNADRVVLNTKDARMIIDGDFFIWPTPPDSEPDRTFTISRGPYITLLYSK